MDGLQGLVGSDVHARLDKVAVEDHVQVLVGGDALEQLVGDGLGAGLAGVAVRDAGGQFLEGHVDDRVEQALREGDVLAVLAGGEPACHLRDA
ncbi:Uncharacterised protein [Mycobacteroides abscessus]|nr:Uncharacterised protein [Mycobacteroides abscessus]